MNILGVKIDNLSKYEILDKVKFFLSEDKFHQIATVNPEFILEAQKNEAFKNILNSCDLNIADGVGIKFASWRYGKNLKCRMTGVDLMWKIIRLAHQNKLTVFLVANKDGLSTWEETRDVILKSYPDLEINGTNLDKSASYQIPASPAGGPNTRYQILFCNFGTPYQETFIKQQKNDTIMLAMGVGGSFDFLTGKVKRAPSFWRFLGMEWLWRLLLQPKRWKRMWNAVIIFPIKIILNK